MMRQWLVDLPIRRKLLVIGVLASMVALLAGTIIVA
jgi:hypothetical protein